MEIEKGCTYIHIMQSDSINFQYLQLMSVMVKVCISLPPSLPFSLSPSPLPPPSQGFAFVSYDSRSNAEKAIESLNGFGYDHLILRVEWAK